MGDSSNLNNKMSVFRVYATAATLDGDSTTTIRTLNGPMTIQTGVGSISNHININALAGQIIATAGSGISFATTSSSILLTATASSLTLSTAGQSTMSGLNATISSAYTTLYNPVDLFNWMVTNPDNSYKCPVSGPILVADLTRDTIQFSTDLTMAASTRLLSLSSDGLIETVGLKLYCTSSITTSAGDPLILQTNTSTYVDIRGPITNNGATAAVRIEDPQGVDFYGSATFIRNSFGTGVRIDDAVGLSINDGGGTSVSSLKVNQIASLNSGGDTLVITAATVRIVGDLEVQGDITATGAGGGGGGTVTAPSGVCCVSDKRVKQDIKSIDTATDLELIRKLPDRVSFRYTDAYLETDRHARNITHQGFIAQEMESNGFSNVVRTQHRMRLRNGDLLTDFKMLDLDRIVPYLVGAIKELDKENKELRELILKNKNKIY